MHKNEQKTTELAEVNNKTGLTPIQEQAAILLAAGDNFTAVAEKINVCCSTLYNWQAMITFQCFLNKQRRESKDNLKNGLFGLVDEALAAIKDCLHSENEATRLKAAIWLTDKIELTEVGGDDLKAALREKHTTNNVQWDDINTFDEQGYTKELEQLGVSAYE